mmetsp:Transcript_108864/g.306790  ORF Transcript_108864/g.306790 Transcript_108864/m.306790 type:complete len:1084 (-) Transcript_108864:61-3312(-)
MAGDVSEQLFNEKQLYTGDVVGEDEGEDNRPVLLPGGRLACGDGTRLLEGGFTASSVTQGAPAMETPEEADDGGRPNDDALAAPSVAATNATTGTGRGASGNSNNAVTSTSGQKRRKRTCMRATQIICLLETKYNILHEVCASFENWKEALSVCADFDLLWCDCSISADRFMKLRPYQKMNHFVGMSSITRKNNLGRNLLRMRKQFPKEYRFFPDTWILPTDLSDFKQQFSPAKNKTFIIKPDNGCQGKGIFLVRDVEKVPVDFSTTYVAQRYVHRPFLLDGYKFDLRLYTLVAGCDPLRIFLHRRGLVRLASEPYVEPTMKNLAHSMVHLTNYAINKMNPNFEENTNPEDASDGHKRSWEAVREHLRAEGHDVEALIAEIEDLIIKTLISVQPSLSHFYHSCQPDDLENAMCFEILGFDVILDHKLQPWLLEVNHAPSFSAESELDHVVKEEVLRDTFLLLNICPDTRRQKKREAREKMEQRALGVEKKTTMKDRTTTEHEVALQRTVWEDAHCNGYKRLYPSEQKEREYMAVHDAACNIWEMLMGGNARRSVRLTQPECNEDGDEKDNRKGRKGGSSDGAGKSATDTHTSAPELKRTAEEIREVVQRLTNGCSARPRANGSVRERSKEQALNASSQKETANMQTVPCEFQEDGSARQSTPQQLQIQPQPHAPNSNVSHAPRVEVQVGDMVKVQTNLGWESVKVRAKRRNGKIDIQFKDGEYMRAVLPRVLRETNGSIVVGVPKPESRLSAERAPPEAAKHLENECPYLAAGSAGVAEPTTAWSSQLQMATAATVASKPSPPASQTTSLGAAAPGCGVPVPTPARINPVTPPLGSPSAAAAAAMEAKASATCSASCPQAACQSCVGDSEIRPMILPTPVAGANNQPAFAEGAAAPTAVSSTPLESEGSLQIAGVPGGIVTGPAAPCGAAENLQNTTIDEALVSLDTHIRSQIRVRFGRPYNSTYAATDGAALQVRRSGHVAHRPANNNHGAAMASATMQSGLRPMAGTNGSSAAAQSNSMTLRGAFPSRPGVQSRVRQPLQQLISVRPLALRHASKECREPAPKSPPSEVRFEGRRQSHGEK